MEILLSSYCKVIKIHTSLYRGGLLVVVPNAGRQVLGMCQSGLLDAEAKTVAQLPV